MPSQTLHSPQLTYLNVTKSFVTREVERQIELLPQQVQSYIRPDEVMARALDSLPPLYLPTQSKTSEKGWHYQYQLAKHKLQAQVAEAVKQALIAIRYAVFMGLPKCEQIGYLESWLTGFESLAVPASLEHSPLLGIHRKQWNEGLCLGGEGGEGSRPATQCGSNHNETIVGTHNSTPKKDI